MICVVDYGVGNLRSILGAFEALGEEARLSDDAGALESAARVVLPGVGAFGDAADRLRQTGLFRAVQAGAARGARILGICLGMQLLFESSEEYGFHAGLALLPGRVAPLRGAVRTGAKVPHMGWNALRVNQPCALTKNLQTGDCAYYVHSFYAVCPKDAVNADSEYAGAWVPGLVSAGNVYGCQFHPEKSGDVGLGILKAFAEVEA